MDDQFFFADVALPFHFWVRERSDTTGYRWVLRKAPDTERAIEPGILGDGPLTSDRG